MIFAPSVMTLTFKMLHCPEILLIFENFHHFYMSSCEMLQTISDKNNSRIWWQGAINRHFATCILIAGMQDCEKNTTNKPLNLKRLSIFFWFLYLISSSSFCFVLVSLFPVGGYSVMEVLKLLFLYDL